MRYLLLLSIAALLGVTLSAPRTADASPPVAIDDSGSRAVDVSDPVAAGLSANWSVEADRLTCFGQRATLVGTSADDVIVGTAQPDVIVAAAGDDVVRSGGGDDLVCGGDGDDRLFGANSTDRLSGAAGADRLVGGHGRDRLSGGQGNDSIVDGGGGHRDVLLGGPGDDLLRTPDGAYSDSKILDGGRGADQLINVGSYDGVLVGGPGPDALISRGHNDFVAGGPGRDALTLAGSGDTSLGLDADGNQVRIRGARYIVMLPKNDSEPLEVDLAVGIVRVVGAATGDRIVDLSRPSAPVIFVVYGTDGDDILTGRDGGIEMFFGGRGSDTCTSEVGASGC